MRKSQAQNKGKGRRLGRIFGTLAMMALVSYLGNLAAVFHYQRDLEYLPDIALSGTPRQNGVWEMSEVTVNTSDGLSLVGWFAAPKIKSGKVLVFFHGSGNNLATRAFKARYFLGRGYGVFMCEYRGFGGNPGALTEEGVYNDARAAIRWLKDKGFAASKLAIYGESLGSGIGVQMASEFQPSALVLEAPYTSAVDVAGFQYPFFPVNILMHDRFDSISKIARVKTPLLIVHGTRDEMIPIQFGRRLFEAANQPKTFISVEGAGHLNLYDFGAAKAVADWLDKQVMGEKG